MCLSQYLSDLLKRTIGESSNKEIFPTIFVQKLYGNIALSKMRYDYFMVFLEKHAKMKIVVMFEKTDAERKTKIKTAFVTKTRIQRQIDSTPGTGSFQVRKGFCFHVKMKRI